MKKLLFIFSLFALLPVVVSASTGELVCDERVMPESNIICKLYLTSTDPITSFEGDIEIPIGLTLTSVEGKNNWTSASNTTIDLTNTTYAEGEGLTTETEVANLKFSSSNSFGDKTINVSSNDLESTIGDVVRVLSTNNTLKSLKIVGQSFDFDSTKKDYTLKLNAAAITIMATTTDANATFVEGYGSRTLLLQYNTENTVQIIVKSEAGSTNTYTLRITRIDNRNTNNNISSLSISTGTLTPIFNKNTLVYNAIVDSDQSTLKITAKTDSTKANFVNNYGPRTVILEEETTVAELKVKAENGEIKTYTINITKEEKSFNNYLKSVNLSLGMVTFNKNVFDYSVNVPYDTIEMIITAEAEDEAATVEVVGNKDIRVGENLFQIKVAAPNGSIRTYNIKVIRQEQGIVLSNNNNLSNLEIKNYYIKFAPDILTYNLTIKDEKVLDITYALEDDKANAQIIGNNNLEDGSIIKINVSSEDGTINTYQIKINKENNFKLNGLIISLGIVLILLILFFIFKNKIFKNREKKPSLNDTVHLKGKKLVLNSKKEETNIPEEEIEKYVENPKS